MASLGHRKGTIKDELRDGIMGGVLETGRSWNAEYFILIWTTPSTRRTGAG